MPGFEVLLEEFLDFEVRHDEDEGVPGKNAGEEGGKKGLGGRADAGTGQQAARLQALHEGLCGGSGCEVGHPTAGGRP